MHVRAHTCTHIQIGIACKPTESHHTDIHTQTQLIKRYTEMHRHISADIPSDDTKMDTYIWTQAYTDPYKFRHTNIQIKMKTHACLFPSY